MLVKDSSWRKRIRWISLPLALVALGWTVWLLWGSWPQLQVNFPKLHVRWLAFTLVGNVISGYLGFEAFRVLFIRMHPATYSRTGLAHLYFVGQLMKHLPGRIWGVAYQSAAGRQATLTEWVGVTAIYMVLATLFALWAASIVIGFMVWWLWGVLALCAGLVIYTFGWNARLLDALLDHIRKVSPKALYSLFNALQSFTGIDASFKSRLWCWFMASWLVYLLAWAGYGMAWPDLTAADGIWLCAIYTVAWFVGYISLISPSGVGVRELVFVLLAHRFPPDAIAGMAVLGRTTLLIVDLILGAAFLPFRARLHVQHTAP